MLDCEQTLCHVTGLPMAWRDCAQIGFLRPTDPSEYLLRGIGTDKISAGGGGADIGPAVGAGHVPSMSLDVDSAEYFRIHHTMADTVDKIDPTDLANGVASIAVMMYVIADMPVRLGH